MNREILFRGKRADNDEWVDGYIERRVDCIGSIWVMNCPPSDPDDTRRVFEVISETVGRYTGLTDKNGKKIFEGDIVGFVDTYSTESGYAEMSCIGKVLWDAEELCFYVTERLSAESWEVLQYCEIIGNVHNNPELKD